MYVEGLQNEKKRKEKKNKMMSPSLTVNNHQQPSAIAAMI